MSRNSTAETGILAKPAIRVFTMLAAYALCERHKVTVQRSAASNTCSMRLLWFEPRCNVRGPNSCNHTRGKSAVSHVVMHMFLCKRSSAPAAALQPPHALAKLQQQLDNLCTSSFSSSGFLKHALQAGWCTSAQSCCSCSWLSAFISIAAIYGCSATQL